MSSAYAEVPPSKTERPPLRGAACSFPETLAFHHTLGITFLVASLDGFTFVVFLLAFSERDNDFDEAAGCEKFGRHDAHAGLLLRFEMIDLLAVGQELARAGINTARTRLAALLS